MPDRRLVLVHHLLQLIHLLGERKSFTAEIAVLRLDSGLAESGGETLVYVVVCKMFGFARVLSFLGSDRECGERLGCLPWSEIDNGILRSRYGEGGTPAGKKR